MGGKFPHPSATGGNLRPRNAPTVPRVPRLGDFSRHLRGTAWCFEEHLSTHVEMKPEKIRPRGFTRNKTQMGLGGRSLKEKVIWLLRDPFPEIYHIIYRHILYYMRYMLQYVPPPKKKRSTIFGGMRWLGDQLQMMSTVKGEKNTVHHTARCLWCPNFLSSWNLRAASPMPLHPTRRPY